MNPLMKGCTQKVSNMAKVNSHGKMAVHILASSAIILSMVLVTHFPHCLLQGMYSWSNKRRYEGNWVKHMMHGHGKFYLPDGRVFEGKFVKDRKEGMGTMTYKDGRKEIAFWEKNRQNGKGYILFENGKKEYTEWKHGRKIPKHRQEGLVCL